MHVTDTKYFRLMSLELPLILDGGKITLTKITSYFTETMMKMPLTNTTIKGDNASITKIELSYN